VTERRQTCMRLTITVPLSLGLLAFGAAACGNDDTTNPAASSTSSNATTSTPTPRIDLDGRTFLSQSATDGGAPKTLVTGTQISLYFADGRVGGSGGCNSMGGDYTVDGDVLRATVLSMTEMACDEDRMAQDEWLAALLTGNPKVALDGDTLTITGATSTLVLLDREVADPDRALLGTVWKADTLIDGDAASSIADGVEVELRFGDDGQVNVRAGCNSGSATFDEGDGTITFGDLGITLMACDDAVMAVESHVLQVLDGEAEFTIEAARLTLTNGDAGLGLTAVEE